MYIVQGFVSFHIVSVVIFLVTEQEKDKVSQLEMDLRLSNRSNEEAKEKITFLRECYREAREEAKQGKVTIYPKICALFFNVIYKGTPFSEFLTSNLLLIFFSQVLRAAKRRKKN